MRKREAISGVFVDENKQKVLLLRRNQKRTYAPGKWDLMGGDILPGVTPSDTLMKDAFEKLNLQYISIVETTQVTDEEIDAAITRYVFICSGDYSGLSVDARKYDQARWFEKYEILSTDLSLHAQKVLKATGFIE